MGSCSNIIIIIPQFGGGGGGGGVGLTSDLKWGGGGFRVSSLSKSLFFFGNIGGGQKK